MVTTVDTVTIVMLSALFVVCTELLASLTLPVKVNSPTVVGVPVMAPPLVSVKPGGRAPLASDHMYGAVPPLAVNVAE